MPLITIILVFIFVGSLFLLSSALKNRAKLKQAIDYGVSIFEIELPHGASVNKEKSGSTFPAFSTCSDAEAFFQLITPYIGSLSIEKRENLALDIEKLKTELKVNKEIYRYFTDEYSIYKGLTDEQAAQKWSGK